MGRSGHEATGTLASDVRHAEARSGEGRARRWRGCVGHILRAYWPLWAVAVVALAIHGVLVLLGQPWSAGEWASSIVFAYVITVATVLLTRRQDQLQQAISDANLVDMAATVEGKLDDLSESCRASTAEQILGTARAGLRLVPFADPTARREFLHAVQAALLRVLTVTTGSVRPYSQWDREGWAAVHTAAVRLEQAINAFQVPRDDDEELTNDLRETAAQVRAACADGLGETVPFDTVEQSFRHGHVSRKVRVLLNWDLLRTHIDSDAAAVRVRRTRSTEWLRDHRVYSVWYADADGGFADYRGETVRPIPLHDIDRYFRGLSRESRSSIQALARYFDSSRGAALPHAEIVTLEISPDRVLVLDGNHRIAAMCLSRGNRPRPLPVVLIEYRITAPLSAELLPDIAHHEPDPANEATVG